GRRALAPHAALGDQQGSRVCPKRARIVARSTDPPEGATVVCVDERGPVTPRNFPPAPGWSPDGHRSKAPLDYDRGFDKVWVYGALCVQDGQALTQTAPARNTAGYLALRQALDRTYPQGDLYLVTDNLSRHLSSPIRIWLAAHPRFQQAFIPVGAAWLNFSAGWWRLFRRNAFAGASLANADDIAYVTDLATTQLNRHAKPWVWGRPPPRHRTLRRCVTYRL
ncbi:MAG TPA: transposase, partial [Ktedonobacterales bacterium]|nr:transposase [Ktedonobacterales bacterium]